MTLEAGQPVLKVNLRKLKQRLIDTDELIGLYSTARSREDSLEQSVLLERRAKMAAEAAIAESESRCRTALKTVREREEDMAVLRQTIREREAEATALRQTVRDREAVATALRKTIREREAEATALRQRLSSFEAEINEALHAEKDARLAAQRELAAERSKRQAGGATPEPLRKADCSQEHSDELPPKRARLSSSSAPNLEKSGTAVTGVPGGGVCDAGISSNNLSAAGLLPDSVITTARRGSVTLMLRMLEGELMRWLFSACALRTADAATPLTSVVIQPSGVGAASIEVLQKLLGERGDDWMREWLSGLARAIVGTDRCLPLAPPSLQRAVLACHLFASCCRERGDTKRVRVLCFDLARYRRCDEAALLAALCSAWPQALHSKGCDEMPNLEMPILEMPNLEVPNLDERATMAWQLQPGAPLIAVLALRLRRQLEATSGERRALLERARTVLIRYGGRAWTGEWDGDGDASRRRPTDAIESQLIDESQLIEVLIHSLLRPGAVTGAVTSAVTGARPPEVQRSLAANGRTSAATSVPGTTPQSRQPTTLPMASAVEGCVALELLAAGCAWSWTVNTLIRGMLLPLLAPEQGAHVAALLRLLGRLGQLAPSMEDPGVSWVRRQLCAVLGVDAPTTAPRFSPAEEACAVAALLELVPPGTPVHEARGAMQAIELWLSSQPKSWEQAVPATLRDRYYEYAREVDREL